ncbi:MAG TPA: NUDIX hydrolase [Candidatus Saccharimonadales bacterium]
MKSFTGILPILPDGRVVLHRRDGKTPVSPELLGFFGGDLIEDEAPLAGARRELGEETSLNVGTLVLKAVTDFVQTPEMDMHQTHPAIYHIFSTRIDSPEFDVFEGAGKETIDIEEALLRDDLTDPLRRALEEYRKAEQE